MATVNDPRTAKTGLFHRPAKKQGPGRWRWTADQFRELSKAGYFRDRHVELVNGELYELVVNPPHDTGVYLAFTALQAIFGSGYVVRPQMTLDLGRRYQPIPDVAVVPGERRDYALQHPDSAVLLVEVADSSLQHDRVIKAHRYALAGIADYWILNLVDRQLEVYRNPGANLARPARSRYLDVTTVPAGGHAEPLCKPHERIAVSDMLP